MKIRLTYFKPHGSYYTESVLHVDSQTDHAMVIKEVRNRLSKRTLPGLVPNHSYFHVLVTGDRFVPTLVMEPNLND
jgi:hypothetical protein